jgi:C-terminal processing protease CtpA/Prc
VKDRGIYVPDDLKFSQENKVQIFNYIWEITKKYHGNREFIDSEWDRVHEKFLPLIKNAQSEEEFYDLISRMLMLTNSSHTGVYRIDQFNVYSTEGELIISDVGLYLKRIENKVVVTEIVDGSEAIEKGVEIGDIILSVDNRPIEEISKPLYRVSEGAEGSYAHILLSDKQGNRKEATLKRKKFSLETPYKYKLLNHNIGYIRMPNLLGDRINETKNMLSYFSDADGLIVDLRGVVGGYIISFLAEEYSGRETSVVYNKPIIILVDERTRSAQEVSALFMRDRGGAKLRGKAKLVGTRTCGCAENVLTFTFDLGGRYFVSIGTSNFGGIEGVGVEPDVRVDISIEDIRSGRDPQLDKAIEILTQGRAKKKGET